MIYIVASCCLGAALGDEEQLEILEYIASCYHGQHCQKAQESRSQLAR